MAEETKFTLKIGIIASFVAALVVFMLSCLWDHNGKISTLQANQTVVIKNMDKMDIAIDKIPERLASIEANVNQLVRGQGLHSRISKENNVMLKNGAK
jgi:cell division protein FtsB